MRAGVWKLRALAIALVFAAAGFCVAVSNCDKGKPTAAPRSIGSTEALQFTNPPVSSAPAEFDLGDAGFGSAITRYITAAGGLRPYRFTSDGPLSLSNVVAGYTSTLQLGLSGILAGTLPPRPTNPATKVPLPFPSQTITGSEGFRFQAAVRDSRPFGTALGVTVTGFFNLKLVDTLLSPFRFAMDGVPDGRLGASYLAQLDVVGGRGGVTYSVLSSVDTATGQPVTMDNLGLYLTPDGAFVGRPLMTGVFALKVRCVDSRRSIAVSRNGLAQDQVFNFTILDQPVSSTDLATLQCSVRGDLFQVTRDSLQYRGLVSTLGRTAASLLNSDFAFRLGGVSVSGRLDGKGQYKATLADGSVVQFKVNVAKGFVDVSIKKGSFVNALKIFDIKANLSRQAVEVTVGDAVASSEVLDLQARLSSSRYALNYRLGSSSLGSSVAGVFQITSVLGKDGVSFTGLNGDAWRVLFLAAPRTAVKDPLGRSQGFSGVTSATVRIGANFALPLTGASLLVGHSDLKFNGDAASGVKSFALSTSRLTGKLLTNVIPTAGTGIPLASQSPQFGQLFFPLGLDLARGATGAPFSGEHARAIFGVKQQYKDTPPRR